MACRIHIFIKFLFVCCDCCPYIVVKRFVLESNKLMRLITVMASYYDQFALNIIFSEMGEVGISYVRFVARTCDPSRSLFDFRFYLKKFSI